MDLGLRWDGEQSSSDDGGDEEESEWAVSFVKRDVYNEYDDVHTFFGASAEAGNPLEWYSILLCTLECNRDIPSLPQCLFGNMQEA